MGSSLVVVYLVQSVYSWSYINISTSQVLDGRTVGRDEA